MHAKCTIAFRPSRLDAFSPTCILQSLEDRNGAGIKMKVAASCGVGSVTVPCNADTIIRRGARWMGHAGVTSTNLTSNLKSRVLPGCRLRWELSVGSIPIRQCRSRCKGMAPCRILLVRCQVANSSSGASRAFAEGSHVALASSDAV